MPERRRPVIDDVLLRSGAWFSPGARDEVIVDDAFARANGLAPGSRIRVLLVDKRHDMLIVGTAMSPEFVYLLPPGGGLAPDPKMFGVLYMPEDFLQKAADLDGAYNQLVGMAFDARPTPLANTLRFFERRLDRYGVASATRAGRPAVGAVPRAGAGRPQGHGDLHAAHLSRVAALVLNVITTRMVTEQRTIVGIAPRGGLHVRRHHDALPRLRRGDRRGGRGRGRGLWRVDAVRARSRLPRVSSRCRRSTRTPTAGCSRAGFS